MALRLFRHSVGSPKSGWKNFTILAAYRRSLEVLRGNSSVLEPESQIRLCCTLSGHSGDDVRTCVAEWFDRSPLDLLGAYMWPGLPEFLQSARARGIKLAVLSDYPAEVKLKAMGLDEYFDLAVSACDTGIGRLKPDPAGLNFILKTFNEAPDRAIYIGDRPEVDAEAARRAGMQAFIVGKTPTAASAPWTGFRDFTELKSLVGLG